MNLLPKALTLFFILFWMLFVFVDYWQKHPIYYYSFLHFQYWGLAVFLLALGGGVAWAVTRFGKQKKPVRFINGLSVFGLFLLVSVASTGFAYGKLVENDSFNVLRAFKVTTTVAGTALAVYLVTAACYVLGDLINVALKIKVKAEDRLVIALASGAMGLVLLLFLLGAVALLHAFIVLPLLGALFILGRRPALFFVKKTLWQPIVPDKKTNLAGVAAFYLLLVLMSFNFTAVNVPMPPGFDALTYYANLPSLIGQHHALVAGFQPYNWSLLMSLGHVLFGSVKVSLALSWLGGLLSLMATYAICRNWLKMDVNFTFLALLVFALTPAFSIQSSAELKVDLGLLFVYLSILLLLLNYFKKTIKSGEKQSAGTGGGLGDPELLLAGLLSGFGMGIKLTTLYFAFALVSALWYVTVGKRGFFAAFLASMFLVFLLKIDDVGGLRQYHLGVGTLKWGVLLAALLLLAGIFLENRKALQSSLRATAVYGAFFVLPFLPWLVKNYAESRSLSPHTLLNGAQASPAINLQILEKNLNQNQ